MEYSTVIIFVVTLCSINAAFTINVYDNAESLDAEAVSSCNYQACDQLCRRLGFPGGACVGDRCDCDNFKQPPGQEVLSSDTVSSCNYQACDQLCRRLGFPGGACVGDRCKCDNFKQSRGQEILSSETFSSCNYQACDQLCRRLGFPGGACVGDRCKCDNFKQSQEENVISVKENEIPREENEIAVSRESDVETKDNINNKYNAAVEAQDEETPEFTVRSLTSRGSCDCVPRNCDMYCFRIHYTGGICVTGQCRCYK